MASPHLFFSLNKNSNLAKEIVSHLNLSLSEVQIVNFADGEVFVRPVDSVRNKNVFIIQSLCKPVNENLVTLLVALDSFRRAGPKEVNVILPYFCYSRQDRKVSGREPITARLMADLLTAAGATRVLLVEIHSNQIQGFFNIPTDIVTTIYPIAEHLAKILSFDNLSIVAPDFGGIKRAHVLNKLFKSDLLIIDKEREQVNECKVNHVIGEVSGRDCLIIDDMLDTGGTILASSQILKDKGANKVMVVVTHGLFSRNALENFQKAWEQKIIEKVYITDTIEVEGSYPFLEVISVSKFLSKIINIYVQNKGSLEQIYREYTESIEALVNSKR
ncbi:ribose-phosphate pyrophosphokinase [Mycoplasma haemofelis Ohio2]|uniref:ribose-phosphate diphosphokinase n=1 Tax=Mycoplasma haemofelis (strain Ohio2) TaxID=859194 RepID=F6FJB5_MYCHI|nr:ribose-phosphate pyrophosphokinase [Mycoplasma haemofelis Ohio2]